MPEMDGYTVLSRLRKKGLLFRLPVIMVSAVQKKTSLIECLQLGARDFVIKPVNMETLQAKIWRSLEGWKHLNWSDNEVFKVDAKILLVEDNDLNVQLVTTRLKRYGMSVESVSTGQEGVEKCLSEPYDLILLDLVLPDISGIDILRFAKSSEANKETPILMLSAEDKPEMIESCMELGAEDFIRKPFNANELYSSIFRCLNIDPEEYKSTP